MTEAGPRIIRTREVPPDPSIANAVGRHHTFETAIADLVDNSIDAGARRILVRLLERDGAVIGLRLIDDGKGMGAAAIDAAMTFARKRVYGSGDLGHFGLGLKAASLSQADELRVFSQSYGVAPVGRVIRSSSPTSVGDIDTDDVALHLAGMRVDFSLTTGTVVEWAEPRTFLSSADARDRSRWVEDRVTALLAHLGTVFHRKISSGAVSISVDVFDLGHSESGIPRTVDAIDPFGYDALPNDPWPKAMTIELDGVTAVGQAHLWPAAQSGRREFRLGGKPGTLAQGLYFYRADRLLQAGGWNTLAVAKPELEYARIAIDLDDVLARHVAINPEKVGLELNSDLKRAMYDAAVGDDGLDFAGYVGAAQEVRRVARAYTKRPVALVEPSRGFGADMLDAFDASVEFAEAEAIDIRWRAERSEAPIEVDLDRRTIWLNEEYRDLIAGPGSMDAADAPFVKTLLMIVYSKYFEGSHLGSRERAELAAWEQLLTAALRDELTRQAKELESRMNDEDLNPKHLDPGTVAAYFRNSAPAAFKLCDHPVARMTIDPIHSEVSLLTPVAGSEPEVTAFERITLRRVSVPGDTREWFELAVDATDMHYEAYVLIESIVDQLRSGATFRHSVSESLEGLKELLARRKKLTDEKVSGLIGELLVLEHVIESIGEESAVRAWLGPLAEQHDFGFSEFDAEVKTTLSESRVHLIGSDTQLEPVPRRPLHLVSVQITRAGAAVAGFTLPDLVESVRGRLDTTLRTFDNALDGLGWRIADADLYRTRYQLRSVPAAYLVDDDFPAITSKRLDAVVPNRPLVGGVSYRVDVTHLAPASAPEPLTLFCKEPE